jgi:hypothetical protein
VRDNLKVKNVDKQQVLESVFRNCVRFDVKVEKGESLHGVTMNGKPVTDEDLEEILSSDALKMRWLVLSKVIGFPDSTTVLNVTFDS